MKREKTRKRKKEEELDRISKSKEGNLREFNTKNKEKYNLEVKIENTKERIDSGASWEKLEEELKTATKKVGEGIIRRPLKKKKEITLRNERLSKGQYTDAADDMLLKLF